MTGGYPELILRKYFAAYNLPIQAESIASRISFSLLKFLFEWYAPFWGVPQKYVEGRG